MSSINFSDWRIRLSCRILIALLGVGLLCWLAKDFRPTSQGLRNTPWVYWRIWLGVLCIGHGTVVLCLFVRPFGRWFGNFLGSWLSRILKIGREDNVSANTLLWIVPFLWVMALLYGAPDFGKNFPALIQKDYLESKQQADSYIGKAWASDAVKPFHEVWGFLTKGSEISVMQRAVGQVGRHRIPPVTPWEDVRPWKMETPKPRYHRRLWPWITAIAATLLLLIDFPLSRRDETRAFFGAFFKSRQERSGSARSSGGDSPPPTATASVDSEDTETDSEAPATQAQTSEVSNQTSGIIGSLMDAIDRIAKSFGPFASDLLAAMTVAGMQKKGFLKK